MTHFISEAIFNDLFLSLASYVNLPKLDKRPISGGMNPIKVLLVKFIEMTWLLFASHFNPNQSQ